MLVPLFIKNLLYHFSCAQPAHPNLSSVSKQVFSKVLISGVYRPFFFLTWPSKIFVPIPKGHVSKRFPSENKSKRSGACRSTEI